MELHVYLTGGKKERHWFEKSFELLGVDDHSEVHRSPAGLKRALSRPSSEEKIVILEASTHADLVKISELHHLLETASLIVLLPDRNPETVALGLSLRPRFLSYADKAGEDVLAVLERVVTNARRSSGALGSE